MSPPRTSALFRIRDALGSVRDKLTNSILVQLGSVIEEQAESQEAELWQQPGFRSRPAEATPGKAAAQFVCLTRSDRDIAIAGRDARAEEMTKNLEPGETCVYATSGQARVVMKKNGAVVIYTTTTNDDSGSGRGVFFTVAPDQLRFEAPWGRLWFDETGFHVVDRSGARMDFGAVGGLPIPGGSTFKIKASVVKIAGMVATLLGAGPTYQQVVAQPLPGPVGPGAPAANAVTGVAVST